MSRWALVWAALLGVAAESDAAELGVTARDVRNLCSRLSFCEDAHKDVWAFCGLASGTHTNWGTTPFPTVGQVRTLTCPATGTATDGTGFVDFNALGLASMGVNQSALVWGATDFLIQRADAELNAWVVDRFVGSICGEGKHAKLGGTYPLFPRSCELADELKLSTFVAGMSTYKAAMREDVSELPATGFRFMADKAATPVAKDAALVAAQLSTSVAAQVGGASPVFSFRDVLEADSFGLDCKATPAAAITFQVAALLSTLPTNPGTGDVELPADATSWRYAALALAVNARDAATVVQAHWPKSCAPSGAATTAAPFDVPSLIAVTTALEPRLKKVGAAVKKLVDLPSGADRAVRLALYSEVIASTAEVAEGALRAWPDQSKIGATTWRLFPHVKGIARDVGAGDFGPVVVKLVGAASALAVRKYFPEEFARIVSFGVEVTQVATPSDFAATLDRFAAPVGSYERKRSGGWYGRLNGYLGGAVALEYGQQADGSWKNARLQAAAGLWAPLGLEVGYGCGDVSVGLFAQAVDLGVLASWRLTASEDALEARPVVGVEQVFSPGAYLVVGLPSAPISLAAGAALTPSLREVEGPSDSTRDAWRWSLGIGVDIPVFP